MKICTFDLETIPDKSRIEFLPEVKPNKRIVVPAKIEADIEDKKKKQLAEMALNPAFAIPCVFGWHDGKETHSLVLQDESHESEFKLLQETWKILKQFDQFVTFNGNSYDINVLLMRSMLNHVQPTVKISQKRYSTKNHFDVRMILGDWDKYAAGTLSYWSKLLLGESSKDELSGDQVTDYWEMGLKDDITKYCESDCRVTFKLFDLVSQYYS